MMRTPNLVISSEIKSKSLDYCFLLYLNVKKFENWFPEKENNTTKGALARRERLCHRASIYNYVWNPAVRDVCETMF